MIDRFNTGWTIHPVLEALGTDDSQGDLSIQGRIEDAVVDLIEDHQNSPSVDKVA